MKLFIYLFFVVMVFALSMVRLNILYKEYPEGKTVVIEGIIQSDPERYKYSYKYILNNISIISDTNSNIYSVGDRVRAKGKVVYEKSLFGLDQFFIELEEVFLINDYSSLNTKDKIKFYPMITLLINLNKVRDNLVEMSMRIYGNKQSALLVGMVLGVKDGIDGEFYDQLRNSGLLHVVVASGGNIVLITSVMFYVLSNKVSKNKKYAYSYIFVIIYSIMTGFEPPIVRAALMVGLIWFGKLLGRKSDSMWILLIIGLIMIFFDVQLYTSVSFYLSILATSGIIMYGSYIDDVFNGLLKRLPHITMLKYIFSTASQTIAAQIMVVPIISMTFGQINIISLLTNIMISFLIAPIMFVGIFFFLVTSLNYNLGMLVSFLLRPLLDMFIFVINTFGGDDNLQMEYFASLIFCVVWWAIIICYYFFHIRNFKSSGD